MGVIAPRPLLIGELAARHGLTVETLRYYETEGLLAPRRDSAGRRVFDEAQQATLEVVVALRAAGLGIRDVASVVALKRPDSTPHRRLTEALATLDHLRDGVDVRRAELDRAADLLDAWRAEAREALGALPDADQRGAPGSHRAMSRGPVGHGQGRRGFVDPC